MDDRRKDLSRRYNWYKDWAQAPGPPLPSHVAVPHGKQVHEPMPGMVPVRFREVHKENAKRYTLWRQWRDERVDALLYD